MLKKSLIQKCPKSQKMKNRNFRPILTEIAILEIFSNSDQDDKMLNTIEDEILEIVRLESLPEPIKELGCRIIELTPVFP